MAAAAVSKSRVVLIPMRLHFEPLVVYARINYTAFKSRCIAVEHSCYDLYDLAKVDSLPTLPHYNGRKFLVGLRYSLVAIATMVLAMDFATLGMNVAITMASRNYTLPLITDFLVIILFTVLAVNSSKLTLFKQASSRLVSGARVVFSLILAALALYNPVNELQTYKDLIVQLNQPYPMEGQGRDSKADDWMLNTLYFCDMGEDAKSLHNHCVVSRVRSLLAVFIAALMLVELGVAYRSRDYRSQQALINDEPYNPMVESVEKPC
ncbi:hypothetical protein BGZ75_002279 [Mortierella antarctica]|nr:hypothetical protein BGZ75_002279 [Mortierella antarctica]